MKIHIYRDTKGEFRWKVLSRNGKILADSGEGYVTRQGLSKALKSLRKNLSNATVIG